MGIWKKVQRQWELPVQALLLSLCAVLGIVAGLCATAVWRRRRAKPQQFAAEAVDESGEVVEGTWRTVKSALMETMRWSGGSNWAERGSWQQQPPLLEPEFGRRGGSPMSPLWQRRILMGERCELPRFSGVILYDERGHPLRHEVRGDHQENPAPDNNTTTSTTTLKDLL